MHTVDRRQFLGFAGMSLAALGVDTRARADSGGSVYGVHDQANASRAGISFDQHRPDLGSNFWPGIDGNVYAVSNAAELKRALALNGTKLILLMGNVDLGGEKLMVRDRTSLTGRFADRTPQITRGEVRIVGSGVRLDHIAIRPGDLNNEKNPWEPDGLMIMGKGIRDIVVSNCSLTWGVDENVSVAGKIRDGSSGAPSDVLLYRCIIAQSLHRTKSHSKNEGGAKGHSCGLLVYDFSKRVAIVECLFASNVYRNPMIKANTSIYVEGCVIANPGQQIVKFQPVPSEYEGTGQRIGPSTAILVNNFLLRGPDTVKGRPFIEGLLPSSDQKNLGELRAAVYVAANTEFDLHDVRRSTPKPATHANVRLTAIGPDGLAPMSASSAIARITRVLSVVGAHPTARPEIDEKIVASVRSGDVVRVIDSQEQAGGYPRSSPRGAALRVSLPRDPQERLRQLTAQGEKISPGS